MKRATTRCCDVCAACSSMEEAPPLEASVEDDVPVHATSAPGADPAGLFPTPKAGLQVWLPHTGWLKTQGGAVHRALFVVAALACHNMCSVRPASTQLRPRCALHEDMGVCDVSVTRVRRQGRALPPSWAFMHSLCMRN